MNNEAGTCKRSLLTDGNDTKKRRLEESKDSVASTNQEDPSTNQGQNVQANLPQPQAKDRIKRKKVVLLLSYSGWGYLGMQRLVYVFALQIIRIYCRINAQMFSATGILEPKLLRMTFFEPCLNLV